MNLFKVNQKEEIPTIKTFCRLVLEPESEVEFYIKKKDIMQWRCEKNFLMIDMKENSEMVEDEINFQEIRAKREGWIFPVYVSQENTLKKAGQAFFISGEELLDAEESGTEVWKKLMGSTMEKCGDLEKAFHFWENYQEEILKAKHCISFPAKYLCSFDGLVYFVQEFYSKKMPDRPIPAKEDMQKWLIGQDVFGTVREELMAMKNQELRFNIETVLQRYIAEDFKKQRMAREGEDEEE